MKCSNCVRPLPAIKVLTSFWFGYRPVHCPDCGTAHRHTGTNRSLGALVVGLTTLGSALAGSIWDVDLSLVGTLLAWLGLFLIFAIGFSLSVRGWLKFEETSGESFD